MIKFPLFAIKTQPLASIFFTVTNDLSYDQRMIRICTSLTHAGYEVMLIGRKKKNSVPLVATIYKQKRLPCFFEKGKLFYFEYNLRLFFFLLFKKAAVVCAIDLDTIIPCYYISRLKKIKRVYDAHEYFSQQKEIISRPGIYRIWHWVEKTFVPDFTDGYTVGSYIAAEFEKLYNVKYQVIRNLPVFKPANLISTSTNAKKIIIYQGAVNEARGLEYLIPAMKNVDAELHIYGDGNFVEQIRGIVSTNNLADKVFIKGKLLPDDLDKVTQHAYIGVNLVENTGLNQYYSLANKFFDLIQHEIPQVTMDYPEYKTVNDAFEVAVLIRDLQISRISNALNSLLNDVALYDRLKQHCSSAKKVFNWQQEEKKLIAFYKDILG